MTFTTTDQHESGMSAQKVERDKARPLEGMKAICEYTGKSVNTVLKYIREEDFPAFKIGGGWASDREEIDKWRLKRISSHE